MFIAAVMSIVLFGSSAGAFQEGQFIFPPENFHNHSSSIVETPGGDLLACWFHGRGERTDDTLVILGARKRKGAPKWSAPFVMADNKNLPDQNPVLFIDPQGRLWLFWISAIDNLVRSYFIKYRISTDYEGDGPPNWTWQDALFCFPKDLEGAYAAAANRALAEDGITGEQRAAVLQKMELAKEDKLWQRLGWMPRLPPIMLSENRMMLGLYSDVWGCSMMAFTEDGGVTWEFSAPMFLPGVRTIQPALVRKANGNVVAFMRSAPTIRRAESSDGGMTWAEGPMDIPNFGSSVAVAALDSGNWVLLCNAQRGRHALTAFLSDDEGKIWKWKRDLDRFPSADDGTASYPTVIQTADGAIHCTYSFRDPASFEGRTIKHVRFSESWVRDASQ